MRIGQMQSTTEDPGTAKRSARAACGLATTVTRRRGPAAGALASILLAALPLRAAPPATQPSLQDLAAELTAALTRSGAAVGVSAIELRSGSVLIDIDADEPLAPASNQKILTSAFALSRLGAGFRFLTGVFAVGGDLLVAGDGDPTLGDPLLAADANGSIYAEPDRWAAAAKAAGLRSIRHVLVLRDPRGELRCGDWPAGQLDHWYAAPVALLNFHDNCFDVTFRAAPTGGVEPVVRPESRYIRVIDRLSRGGKHLWSLRDDDAEAAVTLAGSASKPSDEPFSVAVRNPPMLLGRVFADRLVRAGLAVAGEVRAAWPGEIDWPSARLLARSETPLAVVMRRANKCSLNMMAEAMFLRAGDGTWAGSREMMEAELAKRFGLRAGELTVRDGSGLSRANRAAPAALTRVLREMLWRADRSLLLDSLPAGGVDGTLEGRFTAAAVRGRVVAKTGTVAGVSALSGYVADRRGVGRVAFSVLVNRLRDGAAAARHLQDAIVGLLIADLDRRGAPAPAPVPLAPPRPPPGGTIIEEQAAWDNAGKRPDASSQR